MTKSNLGRKRAYCSLQFQVTVHLWGKSRQEPAYTNWHRGHGGKLLPGLLLMACPVCFPMVSRYTNPGVALAIVCWAFPQRSSIKKSHHRFAQEPSSWGHFLNWDSLFQNDSSLYWVGIKLERSIDTLLAWHTKASVLKHNLSLSQDVIATNSTI